MIESDASPRLFDATLQTKLGVGSVGEVWRAVAGQRDVAIKYINQPYSEPQRKSIETEIQTLGLLQHPAIPELYDFDLDSERPCIVMEYIDGEPFHRIIADQTLWTIPINRRLDILAEVAAAAEHLHERGLIHRDIKPANIIGIDNPHLIDYGIAAEIGTESSSAGTPFYMFPGDQPIGVTHDLFGFALTAYEFLFGVHAIFTAQDGGLPRDELKGIARGRLRDQTWRVPSRIPEYELPYDLRGVDLASLDEIFTRGLDWKGAEPLGLTTWVEALKTAILTPENQLFIDRMPEIAVPSMSNSRSEEVPGQQTAHADTPALVSSTRVQLGALILIAAVISLVIFLQNQFQS